MLRLPLVAILALLTVCASPEALADAEEADRPPGSVHWHREWAKVGAAELALGGTAVVGAMLTRFLPEPPPARMHGGILLDDSFRNLRFSTAHSRKSAGTLSDILWYSAMGWPLLIDPLLVALVGHGSPEVAAQLVWIAFETLALSAFLSTASENLGRERPRAQGCDGGREGDEYCTSGEANRSFMSGHALASFAGAGLVCASHQSLPLYGGGAGDVVACGGALAVASGVAVLRIASDNHWSSDVLFSGGLGFALGYLLPKVLHFGFGGGEGARATQARLVPLFGEGITGLALSL